MCDADRTEMYLNLVSLALNEAPPNFPWRQDELPEVWESQVAAPLTACVHDAKPTDLLRCAAVCEREGLTSVRELLHAARPPVELLRMLAAWTESLLHDPRDLLPRDVSLALFSVACVLAR